MIDGRKVQAWRVRPLERAPAAEQLARTEALWQEVAAGGRPVLRWYSYTRPALVLGVGQQPAVVDLAACRNGGVDVLKRSSGGTVVPVDRTMLALDVALPAGHPRASDDVVEAYRWLGESFARALGRLAPSAAGRIVVVPPAAARADQAAQRASPPESPASLRRLACFGVLSPYEVALAGEPSDRAGRLYDGADATHLRKLVGLAQLRKRGVVLFQAGVYARFAAERLAGLLALPRPLRPALAGELDRRIATLADLGLGEDAVPHVIATVSREVRLQAARPANAGLTRAENPTEDRKA